MGPSPSTDASDAAAAKAGLRRELLARRAQRPAGARRAVAEALARHVLTVPGIGSAGTVAAYAGAGAEPGTGPVLETLTARGLTVLLPVVRGDGTLDWAAHDGRLRPGRFGLPEPAGPRLGPAAIAAADLALLPALAVDHAGHRLGRGAGYYDRALAGVALPAYAVVHDDEVLDALPTEPHDRDVAGALTPSGVLLVQR